MPDYFYDMDLVVDPLNPSNVVAKGQVAIYDPADTAGTTLLALKDPSGLPLPNPLTSNANGFLPPRIASVPQTLWKSGGFEGYFNSFKGLRDEAILAVAAAQGAADSATAAVAEVVTTAAVDGAGALVLTKANGSTVNAGSVRGPQGIQGPAGQNGTNGQNGSNVLPTQEAIEQAIITDGPAKTAIAATVVSAIANTTANIPLYADMPFTPGSSVFPYFTDSTKAMGLGSSTIDYAVTQFNAAASGLEQSYFNGAKFGERWQHQLARLGAVPALLTFPSNTIPASGAVTVTAPNLYLSSLMKPFTGTVSGIAGTLSCNGTVFTFTRTTAGTATASPADTPFIPDTLESHRGGELYLNIGKNNFNGNEPGAEVGVIAAIHTAYRWAAAFAKRVLVIGYYADTTQATTGEKRRQITAANDALRKAYGAAFVDLQAFVSSPDIWVRTGITPTATDLSEQAAGNLPPSIAMDTAHFNTAGNVAFVDLIQETREALGWNRVAGAPAPVKTYTRVTSDSFSGANVTTLVGRNTDAVLGGAPKAYDIGVAGFGITSGQLVGGSSTAAASALVATGVTDMAVSIKLPVSPMTDEFWLEARRDQQAAPNSGYRANVRSTGNVRMYKRVAGTSTQINPAGTDIAYAAGDKVTLEVVGTKVRLLINDILRHEITDSSVTTGGMAGFSRTGNASTTLTADDFTVDAITYV